MTISDAKKKYKEFSKKEPDEIVNLSVSIPRFVHPIGYCPQISYHSNKWEADNNKWNSYIHWWDNPTLVCVSTEMKGTLDENDEFNRFYRNKSIDLGQGRHEVTFLGYAIDFNLTSDDRSGIDVGASTVFIRNRNPQSDGEIERVRDSYIFEFNSIPRKSKDFVVCSPNGRIVYVISDDTGEVYAFINKRCHVTAHGIEG